MTTVRDFDPFSHKTIECPYAFYAAMRREAPVYEASPGVFLVAGYEEVTQVLKDTENFTSRNRAAFLNFQGEEGLAAPAKPSPRLAAILANDVPYPDTLLSADPPEHTRFKILVNRSLAQQRVARYEPIIRKLTTELIDRFIDRGECEFVSEFSAPLPLTMVAMAIGVPTDMLAKYKDWATRYVAQLSRRLNEDELADSVQAGVDLRRYLLERVRAARVTPQEGIIGDLVNAHLLEDRSNSGKQQPLDDYEVVSILQQLLVAGQDTVNFLSSSLMLILTQNPAEAERLRADPGRLKQFVEEGVRIESPIQALGRFARNDVSIGGVTIPAGARVVILYGCANRDETRFQDAATFQDDRANIREHVGFGAGTHYCVGAWLARLETRIAFEELTRRMKNFRLVDGKDDVSYHYTFIFRALKSLHIAFDKV